LHAPMVEYEGTKMSKSLGNLVFISELVKEWDPMAVRLAILDHSYRQPWVWHEGLLPAAAERLAYARLWAGSLADSLRPTEAGLTEVAAIAAIAINKLPTAVVTLREGTRTLDAALDEMAEVFAIPRWKAFRHVILPQLAPYIAAAARSGLSLVWKIVLVAELLGRPNGVGFEIGVAFQLFDIPLLLAYSLTFAALVLTIETALVQPIEARLSRWRRRAA